MNPTEFLYSLGKWLENDMRHEGVKILTISKNESDRSIRKEEVHNKSEIGTNELTELSP